MNQKDLKAHLTVILDNSHEEVVVHENFVEVLNEIDDYLRSAAQGPLRVPLKQVIDYHEARKLELRARIGIIGITVASM